MNPSHLTQCVIHLRVQSSQRRNHDPVPQTAGKCFVKGLELQRVHLKCDICWGYDCSFSKELCDGGRQLNYKSLQLKATETPMTSSGVKKRNLLVPASQRYQSNGFSQGCIQRLK